MTDLFPPYSFTAPSLFTFRSVSTEAGVFRELIKVIPRLLFLLEKRCLDPIKYGYD